MEKKEFKPLGKALNIVASTNLEVTYTYEDLIFVEHNPFLIRFDEKKSDLLHFYINTDCELGEAVKLENKIRNAAQEEGIKIKNSGKFNIGSSDEEKEEIKINFFE